MPAILCGALLVKNRDPFGAAIGLADTGLHVYLVEKEAELGGWAGRFGAMFPNDRSGREQIAVLKEQIALRPTITVFTEAELVGKTGSFGNYEAEVRVGGEAADTIRATVGSIVIATGGSSIVCDPSPIDLGNGTYLMAFKRRAAGGTGPSADTTYMASSTDGVRWTELGTVGSGGVPGLVRDRAGTYRMYIPSGQ